MDTTKENVERVIGLLSEGPYTDLLRALLTERDELREELVKYAGALTFEEQCNHSEMVMAEYAKKNAERDAAQATIASLSANLEGWSDLARKHEAERDALKALCVDLMEALESIRAYGYDTLSGRSDGGTDDREWQREAVGVMYRRARDANVNARTRARTLSQ